jgi:hypothetical protein
MSYDCPLRGPATGARLQNLGLPEIYFKGAPSKREQKRMRKAYREHAKKNGDTISAMNKGQYKQAVERAFFNRLQAENAVRREECRKNQINSLNPEKAARMQAIRDAWARVSNKN